ncbi:MAG: hypothetical protein WCE90_13430 [Candidatus Zixiibacteriota bacterium]
MEKFVKKRAISGGVVFLFLLLFALLPTENQARTAGQKGSPRLAKMAQTEHFSNKTRYIRHGLDINDFRIPMTNYSVFGQFVDVGSAGGEWPKGTNEFYIYGAGLWVGGTVNNPSLQTLSFNNSGSTRDEVLYRTLSDPRVAVGYEPSSGAGEFAGVTDIFISDHPEDYSAANFWPLRDNADNPILVGIEDSYTEYDDQDPERWDTGINSNAGDGKDIAKFGLGVKVIQRTHSWNYDNNKTIHFFIYQIVNIREDKRPIRNCFVSVMCDPDIGPNARDDLVGIDKTRNLGYAYDSDNAEQGFGRIPGYLAYKFLESPLATYDVDLNGDDQISDDSLNVNGNGVYVKDVRRGNSLGLTSFKVSDLESGDPANEPEKFLIMAGHNYPTSGDQRYAPFDLGSGTSPNDQRFFQNTGPFLLAAVGDTVVDTVYSWNSSTDTLKIASIDTVVGDTVRVVVAVMMAPDRVQLPRVADIAQSIYDIGFILPRPPDKPNISVVPDDKKVLIGWDNSSESSKDPYFKFTSDPTNPLYDPNYKEMDFEGYRLYRSTTGLPGSFELLSSWDKSSVTPRHVDVQQLSGPTFAGAVTYDELNTENYILVEGSTSLFTGHQYLVQVKADTSFSVTDLTLGVGIPPSKKENHWLPPGEPPYLFEVFSLEGDTLFVSRSTAERIADGTYDNYFDDCYLLFGGMLIHFKGDNPSYVPTDNLVFEITGHLEEPEGANSQLGYSYVDTGLINGMTYYYDVVAYDFQPFASPRSLQNGISAVAVTPRSNASGLVQGSAYNVTHAPGSSDGTVQVTTVQPDAVTGHVYEVGFHEGDIPLLWYLKDVTADTVLLDNMANQTGNNDYPVVDGMVFKVMGPAELGFNADLTKLNSHGLSWFFNEVYIGGRNALANGDFRNFRIKFVAGPGDTTAQGFYRDVQGNTPWGHFRADTTHISVPFEVWDLGPNVEDVSDDVRIWPLMYDFYGDGRFHTDDYIILLDKNTSGNTYAEDFFSNPDHDPGNAAYWSLDTSKPMSRHDWDYRAAFNEVDPVWAKGDNALLITWKPNTHEDVFTIKTNEKHIEANQVDLNRIKVVPNPYIVRNNWEPSGDYSRIAFTHLPNRCTLRIYTLSGDLLRTLEHNSADLDGNENWDLLTKNNQKIASGVYIYHVDSPYGEKIGKFAVVR